jgi:hypothetical protein
VGQAHIAMRPPCKASHGPQFTGPSLGPTAPTLVVPVTTLVVPVTTLVVPVTCHARTHARMHLPPTPLQLSMASLQGELDDAGRDRFQMAVELDDVQTLSVLELKRAFPKGVPLLDRVRTRQQPPHPTIISLETKPFPHQPSTHALPSPPTPSHGLSPGPVARRKGTMPGDRGQRMRAGGRAGSGICRVGRSP